VLAATALGHHLEGQVLPGYDVDVDDRRRVVPGVLPVERIPDDRRPKVALPVALADTLVDGVAEQTAGDVDVLPELHEADEEARVLTVREPAGPGDSGVLLEDLEDLPAGRGALLLEGPVEGPQHVLAELEVGLLAQPLDRRGDLARPDLAHGRQTFSF